MFIRFLKNRSGNTQVQILEKVNRKNKLVKHLGTARNNLELSQLREQGQGYLDQVRVKSGIISLFDTRYTKTEFEKYVERLIIHPVLDIPSFNFFSHYYHLLGFHQLNDSCFKDLIIARILHPGSKASTRDWLEDNLSHYYSLTDLYRGMQKAQVNNYQEKLEKYIFDFVTKNLNIGISILFFDVTTLYYESSKGDDFRTGGMSKDYKNNQPQIVVALAVTTQGIPILMRVFAGNKFEGHTFLPCIKEIVTKHKLNQLIVVADAAMLSADNFEALEAHHLQYIVGARLGNLSALLFSKITSETKKEDGFLQRFNFDPDDPKRILIISYSQKRAVKDRSDRKKQLDRANWILNNQQKFVGKYKYLKKEDQRGFILNTLLIKKSEQLEGLKGYITNAVEMSDQEIVGKYHELWKVEKAFRMGKTDLEARPIFHTVKDKIEAHLTIVFASLAISRYVEIQTQKSIEKVVNALKRAKQLIIEDPITGEKVTKNTQITPDSQNLFALINQKLG